ncbi:UNVERIFIED_CONTAM: hypothetical protein Sradi_0765100 [Sesamum radiatum]|uniref:Reverse transcriptase zinc-binding domain-containing protein n=1 Tax=Sesamum radiatum TaxID=300843 RepID=A0AAW2VQL5_SESRA
MRNHNCGPSMAPKARNVSAYSEAGFLAIFAKVSALITMDHEWDERLIREEFYAADTDSILAIKLQWKEEQDELIWHFDENVRFTVCSAYQVALRLRNEATCFIPGRSWNFIWRSKAQPKVVMFAWRCAFDDLPTNVNLRRKGILVQDGCGACEPEYEDALHVLLHCRLARLVWAMSGLPWRAISHQLCNTEVWFRLVHLELRRLEWDLFLITCWALWGSRNRRLFKGGKSDAIEITNLVRRMGMGEVITLLSGLEKKGPPKVLLD